MENFLRNLQDLAQKLDRTEAQVLNKFLRGLTPQLKTLVLTQSPKTLADATRIAMVAETVNKEAQGADSASMATIATSIGSLAAKLDDLTIRPSAPDTLDPTLGQRQPPYQHSVPTYRRAAAVYPPRRPQSTNRTTVDPQYHDQNMICWHCGARGHRQRHCGQQASSSIFLRAGSVCYTCNQRGHTFKYCPHNRAQNF